MKDKIKHIFFDLDHTLWDFDKNSKLAFELMFKKFEIPLGLEEFLDVYEPINMRFWKLFREEQVSKLDLRRGRLIEAFRYFDLSYSIEVIDQLSEDYIDFLPLNNFLIEGTLEILKYLEPVYELHIITNGFQKVQHKKIVASRIDGYFKTITSSEEVGVKKPNALIFNQALTKAEAVPQESLMIGDNFEADIMGAHNLGIETICFNYHQEDIPANFVQVSSLNDLKKYL